MSLLHSYDVLKQKYLKYPVSSNSFPYNAISVDKYLDLFNFIAGILNEMKKPSQKCHVGLNLNFSLAKHVKRIASMAMLQKSLVHKMSTLQTFAVDILANMFFTTIPVSRHTLPYTSLPIP